MQLTIGELIGLLSSVFALAAGILGLLLRMLITGAREKAKNELDAVAALARQELATLAESSRAQTMRIEVRVDQCIRDLDRIMLHVDKLRDKIRGISSDRAGDPVVLQRLDEILTCLQKR